MSAPSVAELGLAGAVRATPENDERRSVRPINRLGRELDAVVVHAVDAREIAAVLEAQGINDLQAQLRYDAGDVFDTAEQLYRSAPYRPPAQRLEWPRHPLDLSLLRGILYLLPALWFHDALRFLPSLPTLIGLMAGILFGWGWSQGLSYLAYQHPGRSGVRLSLLGGLGVLLGGGLAGWASDASGGAALAAALVALAVGSYFTASSVLMSLGLERRLLLSLLPGVLASLLVLGLEALHLGSASFVRALALTGLALAVLGPLSAFTFALVRQWGGRRLPAADLLHAVPLALVGWLYAAFLSLDTVLAFVRQGPQAMLVQTVGTAPVVLGMGVMEWLSVRQEKELRFASRLTSDLSELARLGRRIFLHNALRYLAALIVLGMAWNLVTSLAGEALPEPLRLSGNLVYGLALLASVYLANAGRVIATLPAWLVGVALQFALHTPLGPDPAYLAGGLATLLLLLLNVHAALSDVTSYR